MKYDIKITECDPYTSQYIHEGSYGSEYIEFSVNTYKVYTDVDYDSDGYKTPTFFCFLDTGLDVTGVDLIEQLNDFLQSISDEILQEVKEFREECRTADILTRLNTYYW